jgi:ABC-type polysaccharide/polyol phosphate export permease
MPIHSASYWRLLWELTRSDFKLREQANVMGFLWTLLHPALMFAVMYLLFTKWIGRFVDNYAAYLIVGIVQWQFFEKATQNSIKSLKNKSALIKNFKFPKEIVVLSAVGCVFWSYLLELAVLLAFLLFLGVAPTIFWLSLPALIALHLAFTTGVSLGLSLIAVQYEDFDRIWSIATMAGFYLTPVFYPLSILSPERRSLLSFNPLLHIVEVTRGVLIDGGGAALSGPLIVVSASVLMAAVTLRIFRSEPAWITDRIVEP